MEIADSPEPPTSVDIFIYELKVRRNLPRCTIRVLISALGAAAEPVILRDEAPDDAEAALGAGSEPDDDDEDERGMCSSES